MVGSALAVAPSQARPIVRTAVAAAPAQARQIAQAAGISGDEIVTQQGLAKIIKNELSRGRDLPSIIRDLLGKGERLCDIMEAAMVAGAGDMVQIANAAMAVGAKLADCQECLAKMGYEKPETYAYDSRPQVPQALPASAGTPSALGGGGGGRVASPSR